MRTMMFRALAVVAVGALGLPGASAQPAPRPPSTPYLPFRPVNPTAPSPGAAPAPQSDLEKLKQQGRDLEAIRAEQAKAMENEVKLKREIEAIGNDRRQLNQQLIDSAARVRTLEAQVAAAEERLKPLDLREGALRRSLEGRRAIMAGSSRARGARGDRREWRARLAARAGASRWACPYRSAVRVCVM